MKTQTENKNLNSFRGRAQRRRQTKKSQILRLWHEGLRNIWDIAEDMGTRPSYVASVLQEAGLISGYYDLYNSPENPINIYTESFQGRLGFRDVPTAKRSVQLIDSNYQDLSEIQDRAGQHHCLVAALTMFNRARYSGKEEEADVFRQWLIEHIAKKDEDAERVSQHH